MGAVGRREELLREEDAAWDELFSLVDGFTPEQMEEPGLTEAGWSVKDLLWHLQCWTAEASRQLERVRLGTYVERDWDTDDLNDKYFQESRNLDLATVRACLSASRSRVLHEWDLAGEITPEAVEWFEESGPIHFRDHMADLRAWAEKLASGGRNPWTPGSPP